MDTKNVAVLLLKITGLVLISVCVSQLPAYFSLSSRAYDFSIGEILAAAAIALGPLLLLGLGLWFFPGTIANKVVFRPPPDSAIVDGHPLELAGLTIVGVYLVSDGLIGALRDIVLFIAMHNEANVSPTVPASVIAHIAATVGKLLIGVTLCVGAKGVSRVVERIRG
jgi:hypothetical protein